MKSSRAVDNRMSRHPRRRVGRTVPPLACRRNGAPDLVRGTRRARLAEACESAALPGWCRRPAPAWHARPGGLSVSPGSPGSGTFDTYLSRLRSLELVEGKAEIKGGRRAHLMRLRFQLTMRPIGHNTQESRQ